MKKVLLYSGGWDSYCASFIYPTAKKLYVNLHTPYSNVEMKNLPSDVEIQDLNLQKYVMNNGYHIPQRNAILALIGAASIMPEAQQEKDYNIEVYICGVQEDENAPDKNFSYFKKVSDLASAFDPTGRDIDGKWNIQIKGFNDFDKISLWEQAKKPDMRNIISCHTGNNCGHCLDCKRRLLYLDYIYPNEYKIDKTQFINELLKENWIISKRILDGKNYYEDLK